MQTATPTLLKATINPSQWSLADWLLLAETLGNQPMWGWYRYLEHSQDKTDLKTFSLLQWEGVAQILEKSDGWAYHRYKEWYES
jgi:hypothetical protein